VGRTLVANRWLAGSACGKRQRGRPLNSVVRRHLKTRAALIVIAVSSAAAGLSGYVGARLIHDQKPWHEYPVVDATEAFLVFVAPVLVFAVTWRAARAPWAWCAAVLPMAWASSFAGVFAGLIAMCSVGGPCM